MVAPSSSARSRVVLLAPPTQLKARRGRGNEPDLHGPAPFPSSCRDRKEALTAYVSLNCTHLGKDDVRPELGESLFELLDLLPVPHQVHSLQPHAVGDLYHSPPHRAVRPVLRQRTVTESITVYYSTCTTQSPGFKWTKSRSILSAVQGFTIMVAAPMAGMSLRTGIQSSCRDTECDTQVPDIGFPGSTFSTVYTIEYP